MRCTLVLPQESYRFVVESALGVDNGMDSRHLTYSRAGLNADWGNMYLLLY
jgi:hypothetical protein